MALRLVTSNKVASTGAVAIATGVVLLLCATTVDVDAGSSADQQSNTKKKNTLLGLGASALSLGILAQVYDQYSRVKSGRGLGLTTSSSAQMSPAELSRFQDRVSTAAAKLRSSIARPSFNNRSRPVGDSSFKGSGGGDSASELAARASAQISSFIQNYS